MRNNANSGGAAAGQTMTAAPASPVSFRSGFRLKRRAPKRRWLRGIVWTVCTLAAMTATADILLDPPAFLLAPPITASNEGPGWSDIRQPIPVFAFSGGRFDRPADSYTARRHADGSRVDILTFGKLSATKDGDHDWMRIKLDRLAGYRPASAEFSADIAQLASHDGLTVTRHSSPDIIKTRFGAFTISDLDLSDGKITASCLGYRLHSKKPAFRISGIACGAAHAPIDRRLLACSINRLDILSARDDKEISTFFSNSELKRSANCTTHKVAMRNRSAWLDKVRPDLAVSKLRLVSMPAGRIRR